MVCVTDLRGVNTVLAEVTPEEKQDGLSVMRIFVLFSNKSSGADSLKSSCNKFVKIKEERRKKKKRGEKKEACGNMALSTYSHKT